MSTAPLKSMRNGSSHKISEAILIYTSWGSGFLRASASYYCLLYASAFRGYAQYFLSSAFQYKMPVKWPFILLSFWHFLFHFLFWFPPPCARSKLLYEVMFLIKICSGNFNHSPSRCTIASVTEGWEGGRQSSAEVMTKHKEGNFETRGRVSKLQIVPWRKKSRCHYFSS